MPERELKFHIPASQRTAMRQAFMEMNAADRLLQARYYDTADRHLAGARIALRLRNEDGQWVQTLKAPGADAVSRLELNHPRADATLDLAVYAGTPAGKSLSGLKRKLAPVYETDVRRLAIQVHHQDTVVELAYDQGSLRAGAVELEIHELEMELVSGDISGLFHLAEQWQQQYGLILELRSKAERGNALAALLQSGGEPDLSAMISVRRAGAIAFEPRQSLHQAFVGCASDCLEQIIRNTASLAGIDSELATQQQRIALVHQLRVGVRRLRSCWQFFKPWVAADTSQQAAELRRYFALFGEGRNNDVVRHDITPKLAAAGMPDTVIPQTDMDDPQRPRNLAASAGLQTALLKLLEQLLTAPETDARSKRKGGDGKRKSRGPEPAAATVTRRLNKWLHQISQVGGQFDTLTPEEKHDLRKKIKRLRYSLEFSQSVLQQIHPPDVRTFLLDIQRSLGELNDLYTAEAFYHALTPDQPQAWFAIGWARAMQAQAKQRAVQAIGMLARTGPLKQP